jgi:hypothetical protein
VPPSERSGRPVPADLEEVIMVCLEKDPDRRPASARALIARLDACADRYAWSEEQARAFWATEGASLRRRSGDDAAAVLAAAATVAVDMAARQAGAGAAASEAGSAATVSAGAGAGAAGDAPTDIAS